MRLHGGEKPALEWESLERQDWHLWLLAVLLMFVLGVSLLSFMFPSAFWIVREPALNTPERAFVGFCVLLALTLVYMLQRQATIRRLRRSLYLARVAANEAEQEVHLVSLAALPEVNQFRDSLAMEYRRASHAGEPLSVVLVDVSAESDTVLGRAVQVIRMALRPHEALFRVEPARFGLILPTMRLADVNNFATHLADRLRSALPGPEITSTVITYPDQAGSLTELEGRLRVLVS